MQAIRALYTEDALYLLAEQAVALQYQEPVQAAVASAVFEQSVASLGGMRLRIPGQPKPLADKQVMFAFRWKDEAEGRSGVAP